MKALLYIVFIGLLIQTAQAYAQMDSYTHGYTRSNGSYVEGYHHTQSDGNSFNNYSTRGNTNPYTNERGSVDPYESPNNSSHSNGFLGGSSSNHRRENSGLF